MLSINLSSSTPIYEQLIDEIKRMIDSGELKPGSSLPTIRNLASQLEVANNTVARAYQELETLGLAESRGRKGSFIKTILPQPPADDSKIFKPAILKLLQKGMNRSKIEQMFNNNINSIFN